MSKTFLVTGCSAGLGYNLCKAILKAGHNLIATSRRPDGTPNVVAEITRLGGHWGTLDVTMPHDELQQQVKDLLAVHGGTMDVLINNAGVAMGSPVELQDSDSARSVFDTNFFGVLEMTKIVIPLMREKGGGTIVNISSGSTLNPMPLISVYAASKCAVEGFTEALRKEVAEFNIRVILAHPGEMRTPFISKSLGSVSLGGSYRGTMAETVANFLHNRAGKETVDPEKAAQFIIDAIDGTGVLADIDKEYFRLPMGHEVRESLQERTKQIGKGLDYFNNLDISVDYAK